MKKIVHITPTLYEGGAERLVSDLLSELSLNYSNKYVIYLMLFYDLDDSMFLSKSLHNDIKIITLGKKRGFDFKLIFKLFKVLYKLKPNIVNTHVGSFNYVFLLSFLLKKCNFFHTLHNDAYIECPNKYIRFVRKWIYKFKLVHPITISKNSSLSYKKVYGLDNDTLIYNGRKKIIKSDIFEKINAEFSKYRINEKTKIYINVASIGYLKNQIKLVKAFKEVLKENNNIVLLLIGGVREGNEKTLEEIKKNVSDNIHYLGVKPNVEDYLLLSNFFILPSVIEGMPISIIEAMSAGCIPLCSPVGGIPNMINHHKNGLLSKGYEIEDIYDLIKKSLSLKETKINEIVKQAMETYHKNYSIEICAKKYIRIYQTYTQGI